MKTLRNKIAGCGVLTAIIGFITVISIAQLTPLYLSAIPQQSAQRIAPGNVAGLSEHIAVHSDLSLCRGEFAGAGKLTGNEFGPPNIVDQASDSTIFNASWATRDPTPDRGFINPLPNGDIRTSIAAPNVKLSFHKAGPFMFRTTATPEPHALMLLGVGLVSLSFVGQNHKSSRLGL